MPDDTDHLVPRPDPTLLTTAQLYREIGLLRELVLSEIAHEKTLTETRIGQANLADLAHYDANFAQIEVLRHEVHRAFEQLAERTLEQKQDTKAAVDAALQAAKEAVGQQTEASERSIAKSEAATTKQIEAVTALLGTSNAATADTLSDLKSRMDRMEAAQLASAEGLASRRGEKSVGFQGAGVLVAALTSLVAVASLIALAFKK